METQADFRINYNTNDSRFLQSVPIARFRSRYNTHTHTLALQILNKN